MKEKTSVWNLWWTLLPVSAPEQAPQLATAPTPLPPTQLGPLRPQPGFWSLCEGRPAAWRLHGGAIPCCADAARFPPDLSSSTHIGWGSAASSRRRPSCPRPSCLTWLHSLDTVSFSTCLWGNVGKVKGGLGVVESPVCTQAQLRSVCLPWGGPSVRLLCSPHPTVL